MVVEEPPCLRPAAKDREDDRGALLKTPPVETILCGTVDPIGLQPDFDIFVTGDGDELLLPAADRFRQGGAADLGHGAIDDAGVFVDNRQVRTMCQQPGQTSTE